MVDTSNTSKSEKKNKKAEMLQVKTEKVLQEWFGSRNKESREAKPLSNEEEKLKKALQESIKKINISPNELEEARKEVEKMERKAVEGKIRHLLQLAATKGLALAIATANATQDALLIDTFHDILAKNGLFKEYL